MGCMKPKKKAVNKGDEEMDEEEDIPVGWPQDAGYGWAIVFACSLMNMCVIGGFLASGVIYQEILKDFGESAAASASIVGLQGFFFALFAPISTSLSRRFGSRWVVMVGGLIMSSGYIMSAYMDSISLLLLSFGFLIGTGAAFAHSPTMVLVSHYFKKRLSLANSLAVAGSSLGSFILPTLIRYFIDLYSLRGALLLLGAIMLHICISASLQRPTSWFLKYRGTKYKPKQNCLRAECRSLYEGEKLMDNSTNATSVCKSYEIVNHQSDVIDELQEFHLEMVPANSITAKNTRSVEADIPSSNQGSKDDEPFNSKTKEREGHNHVVIKAKRETNVSDPAVALIKMTEDDSIEGIVYNSPLQHTHKDKLRERVYASTCNIRCASAQNIASDQKYCDSHQSCHNTYVREGKRNTFLKRWQQTKQVLTDLFPFDFSIMSDYVFLVWLVGNTCCSLGIVGQFLIIPVYAEEIGISSTTAAYLVSVVGITDLVVRFLLGFLVDFLPLRKIHVYGLCTSVCGLSAFILPFIGTYDGLLAHCIMLGISDAGFSAMLPVVTVELMGLDKLSSAFGVLMMFVGMTNTVGPLTIGWLQDITGTFSSGVLLCAGFLLFGSLELLMEPYARRLKEKNLKKKELPELSML